MIGYLTDEKEWSTMLSGALTLDALRDGVKQWAPFVDDAQVVVDGMVEADMKAFHRGLKKERSGTFAGEEWLRRFGALILPKGLMDGSAAAERYKVPLGCALIQMQKAGHFRAEKS